MYKFILFLFFCTHLYSQVEIEPLHKDFYRPNFWWPLQYSISEYSQLQIKTSLEDFVVHLPIDNAIGYYLIDQNVSQINVFDNTKKIFTQPLALTPLLPDQYFIGIYGKNVMIPFFQDKIVYTNIFWLPDCWEGLCSLNALYIQQSIDYKYHEVIKNWIRAGGNIITTDANFIPFISKNFQTNNQSYFSFGLGKVFIVSGDTHLQSSLKEKIEKFLPYLTLVSLKEDNFSPLLFPPKKQWEVNLQIKVFLFCLAHLCLIFIVCRYSKKYKTSFAIFLSFINTLIVFLWLGSYHHVAYYEEIREPFFAEQEIVLCHQTHFFQSLHATKWEHEFSTLPMPQVKKVDMRKTKNGWKIYNHMFEQRSTQVFSTSSIKEYFGTIKIDRDNNNITITNQSELDWGNVIFVNQNEQVFLGDFAVGDIQRFTINSGQLFAIKEKDAAGKSITVPLNHWQNTVLSFSEQRKKNFAQGITVNIKYIQLDK